MAAVAMAATGVVSAAQAQKSGEGNWVLIGTQSVDLSQDRDSIDLTKSVGKFRAVRLNARSGDIALSRVQVLYANGAVHNEERSIELNQGERTRPINSSKEDRFLEQINLSFSPVKGGKAKLDIYGLQTDDGAVAKRPAGSSVADNAPGAKPGSKESTGPIAAKPTTSEPVTALPGTVTAFGDVLFGSQYVGFGVDRDVIRVGAEIGKFDKIRLRVLDNDISIKDLKVVYANGETDDLVVNADVKKDTRTKWFNLKGDRFIKEIQMVYKSKPSFKGQARIEVLGEYAEGWLGPNGEGRKFNQGWVLLGAQTAGFIGFDKDVIPVGRNEGGFKKIRVTVKDRAITLNELRVIYTSGQEDVIPVKAKIEAGSTYGPVELKGGTRTIKEVQAKYRSRFIDKEARGKGMAIVEVWGQH
jgi:hypothetical protein